MPSNHNNLETLIGILENNHHPQLLDSHPWTRSLVVLQAIRDVPELAKKSPGQQLLTAISNIFIQMMPVTPPRRGKRLDTRWGEYGLLAAQYFAPLIYGKPVPASLREAWGNIDASILLFVFRKPLETLSESEKELYSLVGNEISITPNSTLSDWHRKGLDHLVEAILRRESFLSGTLSKAPVILRDGQPSKDVKRKMDPRKTRINRSIWLTIGILFLGLLIFGGIKGWQIYRHAMALRQDVSQMRTLVSTTGSKLDLIKQAGPSLSNLRKDFESLKSDAQPFIWMGPLLSWVPVYGGDLASVQPLLEMADGFLASADISFQSVAPVLSEDNLSELTPARLAEILLEAQPQLIEADRQINLAAAARSKITLEKLDPKARDLITSYVDPLMPSLQDGLRIAEELPRLMGATDEGPKSYLILVQNEDELRPTGGLITAVGTLLLDKGEIVDLKFVNSYDLDDWSKPYPAAPWQLQRFMESPVLVLRDTSWFTNFPTAALYAENMYSYNDGRTVDGVIAFDQQFLVRILQAIGPIKLEGGNEIIDANNVIAYIRAEKTLTPSDIASNITIKKPIIMNDIAGAVLNKLLGGGFSPTRLLSVLLQALNERDLLLKIDSPSITSILSRRRWDGAVSPGSGDFLLVADTNVGYNKTNAVVQSSFTYDVDFTKPATPSGELTIIHKNNAATVICQQTHSRAGSVESNYLITDCYYNYMRVYVGSGAELLDYVTQFVPANWLMVRQDVPESVDIINEDIEGVETFGTMQVVPGGESITTKFHFALPTSIVHSETGYSVYNLHFQKQAGTQGASVTIRVHLPNNASIIEATDGAIIQNPNVLYQTRLLTDVDFKIVYKIP